MLRVKEAECSTAAIPGSGHCFRSLLIFGGSHYAAAGPRMLSHENTEKIGLLSQCFLDHRKRGPENCRAPAQPLRPFSQAPSPLFV